MGILMNQVCSWGNFLKNINVNKILAVIDPVNLKPSKIILLISNQPMCIAPCNSFWFLSYTVWAINSPPIVITSSTHSNDRIQRLTYVNKMMDLVETDKSAISNLNQVNREDTYIFYLQAWLALNRLYNPGHCYLCKWSDDPNFMVPLFTNITHVGANGSRSVPWHLHSNAWMKKNR